MVYQIGPSIFTKRTLLIISHLELGVITVVQVQIHDTETRQAGYSVPPFPVTKALRHLPSLQDAAYGSQGVKFAETEGVKISSGDGTEMLDEMLRWRKIPQESTGPMSTLDELQAKTMFFSAGLGFTFGLMVMRFHDIMTIMSTLD